MQMTFADKMFADKKKVLFSAVAFCTAFLLSGCDSDELVPTNALLSNGNCKGVTEPIKQVTLAEAASYRGSVLLEAPEATPESGKLPLFIALFRGVQPTRGFELTLAGQAVTRQAGILEVPVIWTEPVKSTSQPPVDTRPCLVVSVPDLGWTRIEAIDQHGESLGVLNLSPIGEESG